MNIIKYIRTLNTHALGINERNATLVYTENPKKYFHLADDKILTKEIMVPVGISCSPTYQIIERIGDIGEAWASVQDYQTLAIKPASGRGGGGIKILKKNIFGEWISSGKKITEAQVFRHFANIIMGVYSLGTKDRVLIEKCIEPHPFFHSIYPTGVPDFRVILLHDRPLIAMLRVPTDRSDGKANLHQGGLGIGIDENKGILLQAYDGKKYYDEHPDTKSQIYGRTIPYWNEIMELAIRTSKAFPLNYLGIDITIDKNDGPLVMEINVRPGLGIQMANKRGLKSLVHLS